MTTSRIKFLIGAALVGGTVTIGAGAQAYWGDPWGGPGSEPGWGGDPGFEPGWGGGPGSEPGWGGGPGFEPGWGGGPGFEPGWGGGPGSEPGWGGGPGSEPGYPYSGYGPALDRTHQRQREMHDHRAAMQSVGRMLSGRRTFDRAKAIGLAREIEASAGENLTRLFTAGNEQRSPLSRARIGDDMDIFKSHAAALQVAAGELANQLEKQPSSEDRRTGRAWSPDWRRGGSYRNNRWRNEGRAPTREVFNAYTNLQNTCKGCHANFRTAWR